MFPLKGIRISAVPPRAERLSSTGCDRLSADTLFNFFFSLFLLTSNILKYSSAVRLETFYVILELDFPKCS